MIILPRFLHPITTEEFVTKFSGSEPLYIEGEISKLDFVFSWQRLNSVLNSNIVPHPKAKARFEGRDVPLNTPDDFYAADKKGATLIVEDVDRYDEGLGEIVDQLAHDLDCPTRANLYLSNAGVYGYPNHYDTHDFLILQISGEKQWEVFDSTIENPIFHQKRHGVSAPSIERPRLKCTLKMGDVLYVPRGLWHKATASSKSLHLTLAIFRRTKIDFLRWLVDELREDPYFRGYFENPSIEELGTRIVSHLSEEPVAQQFKQFTHARMPFRAPFELGASLSLQPDRDRWVSVKVKHHCFHVSKSASGGVLITGYGRQIDIQGINVEFARKLFEMTEVFLNDILKLAEENQCNPDHAVEFVEKMARVGHIRIGGIS